MKSKHTLRSHSFAGLLVHLNLFILLLAFSSSALHAAIEELADSEVPVPTLEQSKTLKTVNYILDNSHYQMKPLDNDFSEVVLEKYLQKLDPNKNIFIQSDIDQFNLLRHEFDDFIRTGTLEPAFVIFSILRTRIEQRSEYAINRLRSDFDFELNETFQFNREDSEWIQNMQALDDFWRKQIKNDIISLRLAGKEKNEIMDTLHRRYVHMTRRIRQFNSDDVFEFFSNSYISSIDPHSSYFLPRTSENFNIQLRLSLEGIGAVLQVDDAYTKVRRVIPGGPADQSGQINAEDRIIGVAQGDAEIVDVVGWRLDDVVELIRGPKHSIVRLEIQSKGSLDQRSKIVSIKRDKINLEEQAAKKRLFEIESRQGIINIGVIDLPSFYSDLNAREKNTPNYRSTVRDVRRLLAEFETDKIDGLIIDLRGNGGGSLEEAISLSGLFIEDGPIVQTQDVSGQIKINQDPDPAEVYSGPLAVLVDRYSASASEIFSGAIKDYKRGLIIGEPTYGKGTVQHLLNLNRFSSVGQLKLTIAQFFRINGDSTQFRGVIPDIIWPATNNEKIGERAYDNALPWRRIPAATYQTAERSLTDKIVDHLRDLHEQRIFIHPEFKYFEKLDEFNKEVRNRKSVTLNTMARQQERIERDQERLLLENEMRQAIGKETLLSIDALEEERKKNRKKLENDRTLPEPDALLRESGSILGDYLFSTLVTGNNDDSISRYDSKQSELPKQ